MIAANRPVTAEMARTVKGIFTEVVVAPATSPRPWRFCARRRTLRLLVLPEGFSRDAIEYRPISGGALFQEADRLQAEGDDPKNWTLVAGEPADEATLRDLEFAWRAPRSPKSNAILLADNGAAVGIGMGQVNRVDSCKLSVERANTLGGEGNERARGAVAASDAFFPFADGLQVLLDAGVRAVVHPGGLIRDEEVIEAAKAAGVTIYFDRYPPLLPLRFCGYAYRRGRLRPGGRERRRQGCPGFRGTPPFMEFLFYFCVLALHSSEECPGRRGAPKIR